MYMLRLHSELYHPSFIWLFGGSIHWYLRWRDSISFGFVLERVRLVRGLPGFKLLQQVLVCHQHGTSLDTSPHTTGSHAAEPACEAF